MTMTIPRRAKRYVTGHDDAGRSVFLSAGDPPQFHGLGGPEERGVEFFEMWATDATPAPIAAAPAAEPNDRPLRLPPADGGTVVRILDFYPGHAHKLKPRTDGRPSGTHRTETVDYGIVIEGELYLILDDGEVKMLPGDVAIQRGTDHAWENRSNQPARIAFVLIDGRFTPELKAMLPGVTLQEHTLDRLTE